jgi:hypothetical protein
MSCSNEPLRSICARWKRRKARAQSGVAHFGCCTHSFEGCSRSDADSLPGQSRCADCALDRPSRPSDACLYRPLAWHELTPADDDLAATAGVRAPQQASAAGRRKSSDREVPIQERSICLERVALRVRVEMPGADFSRLPAVCRRLTRSLTRHSRRTLRFCCFGVISPAATLFAMSAEFSWQTTLAQLRSTQSAEQAAGLQAVQSHLEASQQQISADTQQPLLNALLHLLHDRSDHKTVANGSNPVPPLALSCVALLFLHSSEYLTEARAQVLQKKLQQLWSNSVEIKQLFQANPSISSEILTVIQSLPVEAASSSSAKLSTAEDAAAAELRKQKRSAKQARVQAEAAELRRMKAMAMAMDEAAIAKARGKASEKGGASMPQEQAASASQHAVDDGTESAPFGNFHTYYQFNPPSERLQFIPPQLAEFILQMASHRDSSPAADGGAASNSFTFLDVGCNEGDLTIGLLQHLLGGLHGRADAPPVPNPTPLSKEAPGAKSSTSFVFTPATSSSHPRSSAPIHAIGVDIDPLLIERATGKIDSSLQAIAEANQDGRSPKPTLQFAAIDVMEAGATERIRQLALSVQRSSSAAAAPSSIPSSARPFHLVCCYSITMWVHLHHGDSGLQHFLSSLSSLTHHLILEPQPWQCYKNARERWRRKGKEDPKEMQALKWRTDVEEQITRFVQTQCGMQLRADLGSTKWQRKVLWFERV